ncbi:spore germination protein GerPC [Salirhabdus salicampi]|uniref:spore germination protein GerPC n=1 Tax=Salirhabdus salicampi TaxID=476102 RepID=UPI0020C2FF80|nr:spore germination protein GerPC [Salirhabdus salicampi]MCP8615543.1 spore germination protein GerPC [Salirhabdus salicampi]
MYYNEWNAYFASLGNTIQQQQHEILQLRQLVKQLEEQVASLQDRPTTNIEKIEYHFDQLKVETLEGTLNIGLSPQGISTPEDISIPSETNQSTQPPSPIVQDLVQQMDPFLRQELPAIIDEIVKEQNRATPPGLQKMILQDIYHQLPERVQYYLSQHNGLVDDKTRDMILEEVRQEIIQSVKTFIENNGGEAS